MPSLQTARRIANAKTNNAKTIGQIYKEQSDWMMEKLGIMTSKVKSVIFMISSTMTNHGWLKA